MQRGQTCTGPAVGTNLACWGEDRGRCGWGVEGEWERQRGGWAGRLHCRGSKVPAGSEPEDSEKQFTWSLPLPIPEVRAMCRQSLPPRGDLWKVGESLQSGDT